MHPGSILVGTFRGHKLKGADRFLSSTKPKGMLWVATVPPHKAPIRAWTTHCPPFPPLVCLHRAGTPQLVAASLIVVPVWVPLEPAQLSEPLVSGGTLVEVLHEPMPVR